MTCSEFTEFLHAYLDGALAPAEAEEFDRHLKVCEDCVNYMDSYSRAVAIGKAVFGDPGGELPDDVPEDLIRAILESRTKE